MQPPSPPAAPGPDDPATADLAGAWYWLNVYSEIAAFQSDLIEQTVERARHSLVPVRRVLMDALLPQLDAVHQDTLGHLARWTEAVNAIEADLGEAEGTTGPIGV